ncbi:hypothetical protein [Bosea sp. BH3]|uniref:hypothetical protein n=1 Tax=Bosea sp. BH3 TaxID=2871701 RepID=UPI0021CB7343|nr:hypothetical protein [Bosea sp. BH3]MCU4182673.1 hypothetical protein [Bosea sp. BH3]
MVEVGAIYRIYAPSVGYEKYHLCVAIGIDGAAHQFLFLNSDPNFLDTFVVNCTEIPCLPPSETGVTAISFSMVPRFNEKQLAIYKSTKMGTLSKEIAQRAAAFGASTKSLPKAQLAVVVSGLNSIT